MARRSHATAQLRREVNARYPLRDTGSDGWIGDAAHRARPSDHNPNSRGVVTAEDFDADLRRNDRAVGGALWELLIASRDDRIKYVIYKGRMFSSYPARGFAPWTPRPYHGSNQHITHLHLSVSADPDRYDDGRPWGFTVEEDDVEIVANIQKALIEAGYDLGDYPPYADGYPKGADGDWGTVTHAAFVDALKRVEQIGPVPHTHNATVELD